jgi:hypothetical protein
MKKIFVFGFIIALGAFLLHQTFVKPLKSANKFTSPDSFSHDELTNPVQTVHKVIPRDKLLSRPDNPGSSADDPNDLLQQLEAAVKTYDPTNNQSFLASLAKLVQSDPASAARFAESLPTGTTRNEVLLHVAQDWAAQDPTGVEAWAAKLPDKNESQSVLSDVCFQISPANAAQAVQMAEQHNLSTMPGVVENLVSTWAAQDFSSAAAWVKDRPAGQQRDQMFERLAVFQSQTDPAEAAKLVAAQIASGPVQDDAVVSVLYMWGLRDMAGATAWVNLFPSGPLKERAEDELSHMAADQMKAAQASKVAH